MIIKNLEITNFRNINNLTFYPCEKVNVICGENAQGKTNLIEAIWLFTGAKSFRSVKDSETVKKDKKSANLKMLFLSGGTENSAEIKITEKRNSVLNGKNIKTSSLMAGNFNCVVFSPSDLNLISGSPQQRRRFLDTAIGQIYPKYIEILNEYVRAVKQRNNILKESIKDGSLLFLIEDFEKIIAVNGIKIIKYRLKYLEYLKKYAFDIYSGFSENKEKLEIEYISTVNKNFEEEIKISRKEDKFKGVTSIGPHRDDVIFKINGLTSKEYSSQGQKRSIALSLKLSEAEIIKEITGESPVILLDDVMSELDKNRQNFILNKIKEKQVFITCCDKENFEKLNEGKIIKIKNGEIF